MWEDNNPLSYDRRSSTSSFHQPGLSPPASDDSHGDDPPDFFTHQPPSEHSQEEDFGPRNLEDDDDDEEEYREQRRVAGYSSRVEQMLMENKDTHIKITDAGKNSEGSGGYIVYTIRTGDLEVRRRYSEFESLRRNLALLHPCLIVPPIPEKHQVSDYVAAPTSAKENVNIIDHRKRMLMVFLNRCAKMREIREDSVFQRFLDSNASWSEVLHSPPISNLPKQHLKAPPLNPSNPSPGHAFLPIPSASAKLRQGSSPPSTSHGLREGQPFTRFPPPNHSLSESELDPYFTTYEAATRTYESLLTGSIERVNRRILKRLTELAIDYNELGARYNAFSLSESGDLAASIEKIGQAVDSSYIATEELATVLGSGFAEPLRESAQFAGVVQKVLRYRVLKRVQEEMTRDLLQQKRSLLQSLERSEKEAKRIEQYLHGDTSDPSPGSSKGSGDSLDGAFSGDDRESIDSDFPPTHSESSPPPQRSKSTSRPSRNSISSSSAGASVTQYTHRKSSSYSAPSSATSSGIGIMGGSITGGSGFLAKGFGKLNYAIHGIVDVDPERTRRDNIGKTREHLSQLEAAKEVAEGDVKDASKGVLKDLRRFQKGKEEDLRAMMIVYAKCHIEWARKNLESWEEAKEEVEKIVVK